MDKFFIGFNDNASGLQSNLKAFLINDNAFQLLKNAYVYRGRVRKRFGSKWMGETQLSTRLRMQVTTASGASPQVINYPTGITVQVGQMISIGSNTFTVVDTTVAAPLLSSLTTWSAAVTSSTSITLTFVTPPTVSTPIYLYAALPVMGITQFYRTSSNQYITTAFDTSFAYQFDATSNAWLRLAGESPAASGTSIWTGANSNFFWMTNYQGATSDISLLWVTNNTSADGIRYYDDSVWRKPILNWTIGASVGTTNGSGNTAAPIVLTGPFFAGQVITIGLTSFTVPAGSGVLVLQPSSTSPGGPVGTGTFNTATGELNILGAFANTTIYFSGNNFIQTSLLIVSFKNRLLLFNTTEMVNGVSTKYQTRCRYSGIGSPLYASSWQQDFPGNGSAIDAPTTEAIVTAQFVKDRLIVYFDNSTFELVYTGNQVVPFVWQKINTELGADSTFSEVPFDKVVLGISNVGIHACNGSNVERIDAKIPQLAFNISTQQSGNNRVAGIRDYYTEMVYWTYPESNRSETFFFPNQVLVYNYVNDSWALNDDSFTTFGYFLLEADTPGDVWEKTTTTWGNSGSVWNSNFDATSNIKFQAVCAGNQQGYVVILQPSLYQNAPALQVSNATIVSANGILTISCVNHNLDFNDYILFSDMTGLVFTDFQGNVLSTAMGRVVSDPIAADTPNSFTVQLIGNAYEAISVTGTYRGGGVIARVSQIDIQTKEYNFYMNQDRNMMISKIDFLVDRTDNGQVTIDYFIASADEISMLEAAQQTGAILGNNVLETSPYDLIPFEKYQARLWHPIYITADGECIQLRIYLSEEQMVSYQLAQGSTNPNYIAMNNFELNAMVFYVKPTSYSMQ